MTAYKDRDKKKEQQRLKLHAHKITMLCSMAYKWVRDNHPLVWEQLRVEVGLQPKEK